jgi:hypothetical protein
VLPDGIFSYQKIPNLRTFLRALEWKMLVYFMAVWNILPQCGRFYGNLVRFVVIGNIFPPFGMMYQEHYGNPAVEHGLNLSLIL